MAAAAVVTLFAVVLQGTSRVRMTPGPTVIPAAFRDGSPSIWLFVKEGCPHCDRHLAALNRSVSRLDSAARTSALARLRIVGTHAQAPSGATSLSDPWRLALGVRVRPTTWLVDGQGRIVARWLGPRDAVAWLGALAFVTAETP